MVRQPGSGFLRRQQVGGPWHAVRVGIALVLSAPLAARAQGANDVSAPMETAAPGVSLHVAGESTEGALFLLLPIGAQGVALGRAMTALPSLESVFWNPAGLAALSGRHFLVFRGEHVAGEATSFSLLFTSELIGALGLSYHLLDMGEQAVTDPQGNEVGELSVRGQVALASFATELFRRLNAGLNFKLVQFQLSCRGACLDPGVTATTYAVDAGLQSQPLNSLPLRLGAMVAHLGPRLQVINAEQADPLPTRIRLSAAYDVLEHVAPHAPYLLWIALEVEDRWRKPGSPSMYLGSEFAVGARDAVFVRAGYVLGQAEELDGAAVGLGIRYERFDLGVAKSFIGPPLLRESEPVQVTFGISF